jgi:hypothetical protein
LQEEMVKWIDLGLFPEVVRSAPGACSDTPEEKERLLKLAKQFRANFEMNCDSRFQTIKPSTR